MPDKLDIKVEEKYYNKKKEYKSSELCLKFSGKDCNIKILSTFRRVCGICIPNHAFNFANIDITENTCVAFNNDYMKLRLSNLPIFNIESTLGFLHKKYWKNINFADANREKHPDEKNIKIYINSHNNSNEIKNITTKDIKVYIDNNQVEMYDPKAPVLIIKLRPNDTFKCTMTASLAIGECDSIYSACSNAWATYDEDIKDSGERFFKSGELILKSRGQQKEKDIFKLSCEYLLKKYEDFKLELERKKKSESNDDKNLSLIMDEEDFTFGEWINYELQDNKDIIFCGLSKPDHQIKSVTLKIFSDKKKPVDLLMETCDLIINKINIIKKQL
jgi:DNA-directed RNA polymerase subunit L